MASWFKIIMVKVAAAQIEVLENVNKNLEKILTYIDKAKSKNVDIVCFPETCLNPIEEGKIDVSTHVKEIQNKCKEKEIYCIFGSYVPEGNKARNVTFLVDRSGKIIFEYDKVHLWISEKGKIIPGSTNKVINTDLGKVGIINCWDYAFPTFIQQLSRNGAKIIFAPSYLVGYKMNKEVLRKVPLVRAFENIAFYISCDAFTNETLSESYICHPLRILKKIEKKEGLIFANLDMDRIDSLRKHFDHLK
ncbi:MAG: carbon-nitrogen hydrolase family protein [Candidatus Aenigmarchaeota archaeon]|nr:carbon-nitrogen hydrolase family protein [Candidatus Aenigmarchaeota archaeon]